MAPLTVTIDQVDDLEFIGVYEGFTGFSFVVLLTELKAFKEFPPAFID